MDATLRKELIEWSEKGDIWTFLINDSYRFSKDELAHVAGEIIWAATCRMNKEQMETFYSRLTESIKTNIEEDE